MILTVRAGETWGQSPSGLRISARRIDLDKFHFRVTKTSQAASKNTPGIKVHGLIDYR